MYNHERLRRRSPLNTKGGAEAFEARLRQLIAEHGSVANALRATKTAKKSDAPKFADFSARWMREYVEVNNRHREWQQKRSTLRQHLLPEFSEYPLNQITSDAVERYKGDKQREGLSAKTINNHLSVLRKCLSTAVRWHVLDEVPPFEGLETLPPPFRYLDETETSSLLEHAPRNEFYPMLRLALRTGLRFSEIIALTWEDLNLERRFVCVRRSEVRDHIATPKNNRIRHVPLTGDAVTVLRDMERRGERVFLCRGRSVRYISAARYLARACRLADIRPITWHGLRHTFASSLASRGASIYSIQALLGHSTVEMTQRYAHLGTNSLRTTVSLLEQDEDSGTWLSPDPEMPPDEGGRQQK